MPVSFSRADVQRIATLARLDVTEAELDRYARQIGDILEYAAAIQAVDTAGVAPYASTLPGLPAAALREDVTSTSLSNEAALQNAPNGDRASGTFVVPKVIG